MMFNTDKLVAALFGLADAALIFSEENRRYFTEFSASDGVLLVNAKEVLFFTDSRYAEAASTHIGKEFVRDSSNIYEALKNIFAENGIKTVAIENDRITVAEFEKLKNKFPDVDFISSSAFTNAIKDIRAIKDQKETEKIKSAQKIAENAFSYILGFIKPGRTEKQIALELNYHMLSHGAQAVSFETIVVGGANSSMPHGVPSDYTVKNGDFITMDFGAVIDGYHSDMTRTVILGSPTEKQFRVYNIVLEAQNAALLALREGVSGRDADKAARDIILKAGFGDNFGHGTGHGVGVEIHEAPTLSPHSESALIQGNVVTVEPGVYLPGEFGVRIEDMAYITKNGHINLASCPKNLIKL